MSVDPPAVAVEEVVRVFVGGILAPVAFLPGWLQPVSHVVFLSWSADLLRASLSPAAPDHAGLGLAMLFLLGCAALAVGSAMWAKIMRRVRHTVELSFQ